MYPARRRAGLFYLIPWFIIGFLVLATARSLGLIPSALLGSIMTSAKLLTVISMAALDWASTCGWSAASGGRVTIAVVVSLLVLIAISIGSFCYGGSPDLARSYIRHMILYSPVTPCQFLQASKSAASVERVGRAHVESADIVARTLERSWREAHLHAVRQPYHAIFDACCRQKSS